MSAESAVSPIYTSTGTAAAATSPTLSLLHVQGAQQVSYLPQSHLHLPDNFKQFLFYYRASWPGNPSYAPQDARSFLIVALSKLSIRAYCSQLIQQIVWGALVRVYTALHGDGPGARLLPAQLRRELSSASSAGPDASCFDEQELESLHKRWVKVAKLLQNSEDEAFWLRLAFHDCPQLNRKRLEKLVEPAIRATWELLPPQQRHERWTALLDNKSAALIPQPPVAAHITEVADLDFSVASDREQLDQQKSEHALAAADDAAACAVFHDSEHSEVGEMYETESSASEQEECAAVLEKWHRSISALLPARGAPLWKQLHTGKQAELRTAESLLVAMEAVSQWDFYRTSVSRPATERISSAGMLAACA